MGFEFKVFELISYFVIAYFLVVINIEDGDEILDRELEDE